MVIANVKSFISRGVAVVGAGGAGDVVSSYVVCEVLRDLMGVKKCLPVALLWERWSLDPFPGPIPKELIRKARLSGCVWISGSSFVERPGYRFKPQASAVAEVLGREVPSIDLWGGVSGFLECFDELRSLGYESVMLLDVGGDILARGWEEGLWSPLADSLSLAAASHLNESITAVLAPGADGELSQSYVMGRIAEASRYNGFLGAIGLLRDYLSIYELILPKTSTEAGKAAYLALKGDMGVKSIRKGTRTAEVTPATPVIYLLDTEAVMSITTLPQVLRNVNNLKEAQRRAHELGIITELDLEEEAAREYGVGPKARPDWHLIRESLKRKIKLKNHYKP